MNIATRNEVTRLLRDATLEGKPYATQMKMLNEMHRSGTIPMAEYLQLVDATNIHNTTGSYSGCIIWKNAAANPIE